MLDAYIIDQIRRREEESRRIFERPALKIPLEPADAELEEDGEEEKEKRRVIVIDL